MTGAKKEPLVGFKPQPSLHFITDSQKFLPTSNTSINWLNLSRATVEYNLSEQSCVFPLHDYTSLNQYSGQKFFHYIIFAKTTDFIKHNHVTEIKNFSPIVMLKSKK